MKKFLILGLLLAPIAAHATDPVGPSAVPSGGTAVVATAPAPYQTAAPANGDSTTVVSASYVKGAYNDAIAAVNKVNNDKQAKLLNGLNNHNIESKVVAGLGVNGYVTWVLPYASDSDYNSAKSEIATDMGVQNLDDALISAGVVLDGLHGMGYAKQDKLTDSETGDGISTDVISADYIDNLNHSVFDNNGLANVNSDLSNDYESADQVLMSAGGVFYLANQAKNYTDSAISDKRVSAVTTWGNDTPTKLQLTNQ